jgi:hypothetical protein
MEMQFLFEEPLRRARWVGYRGICRGYGYRVTISGIEQIM